MGEVAYMLGDTDTEGVEVPLSCILIYTRRAPTVIPAGGMSIQGIPSWAWNGSTNRSQKLGLLVV